MTLPAHELAQQVLDADADATPGPWERHGDELRPGQGRYWLIHGPDAALIALYRTAAPALARRVVALEDALRRPRLIAIRQAAEWLDDEGAQTLASELHQLHEDLSRVLAGDGADQAGTA